MIILKEKKSKRIHTIFYNSNIDRCDTCNGTHFLNLRRLTLLLHK